MQNRSKAKRGRVTDALKAGALMMPASPFKLVGWLLACVAVNSHADNADLHDLHDFFLINYFKYIQD